MDHIQVTSKRIILYVLGIFFLSLGVSLSIQADLGVSPVQSLAYAVSLSAGLSIGITTVLANIFYIFVQIILNKTIDLREFILQLVIAFLFGFFMDVTLFIVRLLPTPDSIIVQILYLIISLFVVGVGLLGYFFAKLPVMPYDALTYVISEKFKLKFSKAKVISDLINVCVAGVVCLIFIKSLGSIGIGTLIAALLIGRILGWMMKYLEKPLQKWVYGNKNTVTKNIKQTKKEESSNAI